MSPIRGLLILAIFSLGSALTAADSPGDLAIHARAILKKHCAECHDGQAGSRSSLLILDYAQLVAKNRQLPAFVKPKAPLASQIVEFIEDGSMPPGSRPKVSPEDAAVVKAWIEAGARAYPRRFDDAFADAMILADLSKAPAPGRKKYRYFSLYHLLDGDSPLVDLSKQREAFRKAVNGVAKGELDGLNPIDPTETIFRVNLHELGWDATPFNEIKPGVPELQTTFSVFDLLLLEYPFGEMPPATKDAEQLAELWLRPIAQIRPIVHVRADWFAEAVDGTLLKTDLSRLIGLGAKGRGAAPENKSPELRLEDLPPIAFRAPARTIPIVPIDAWYAADYTPKAPAPKIEIKIIDKNKKESGKFKPSDRMQMEIKSDQTVFIELIQIDAIEAIVVHARTRLQPNVAMVVEFEGKKEGLLLGDEVGKQRFIVFAAKDKFDDGKLLQSKHENLPIERFVHPFYELPKKIGDPPPHFDPSKMVRKTAIIEVAK